MFPIFVGFGSALLFGIFAFGTYGLDGATEHAWIGMVLGALVAGSLLVYAVDKKLLCLFCRLRERVRAFDGLCRDSALCR